MLLIIWFSTAGQKGQVKSIQILLFLWKNSTLLTNKAQTTLLCKWFVLRKHLGICNCTLTCQHYIWINQHQVLILLLLTIWALYNLRIRLYYQWKISTQNPSALWVKKKQLVILPSLVTLTHILSKMQANSFHGNFLQFNREKIKHCHGFFWRIHQRKC